MYIYSPENKEEFMAYLIVYDTINGEWKRFYSKDFWNKNDENDGGNDRNYGRSRGKNNRRYSLLKINRR